MPPASSPTQMPNLDEASFWRCVWAMQGAVTLRVLPTVATFGLIACFWVYIHEYFPFLELQVGPVEAAAGALGLMLVIRSNAGYDRWWEARKLWGSIVNSTRNLVVAGLVYGPNDPSWRTAWVHWCAAYAHVCRRSLRHECSVPEIARLFDEPTARKVEMARHMPTYVAQQLAQLAAIASQASATPLLVATAVEPQRQLLIDAIGGCERIASSPLPRVYVLKIRRFIALYLALIPLALIDRVGMLTPFITWFVAYPILGLDRIAQELQSPFATSSLSHLPLDLLCESIEANALAALHGPEVPHAHTH